VLLLLVNQWYGHLLVFEVILKVFSYFHLQLRVGYALLDEVVHLGHEILDSVMLFFHLSEDRPDARNCISEHYGCDENHDDDEHHLDVSLLRIKENRKGE
jgi:hypothetical protein